MNSPNKHRISSGGDTYNYSFFENVRDFHDFVDQRIPDLSPSNAGMWRFTTSKAQANLLKKSSWYGDPTPADVDELNNHKLFAGMKLAGEIRPKIREYMHPYLQYLDREVLPKPKLTYNDRGLGVFSFDRAAMNLQKRDKVNLNSELDRTSSQLNIELGHTKTVTTVRKSYAWFENRNVSLPALRLYLEAGANANIKGKEMLYTGLACSELVSFMEMRRVPVEVNILIGSTYYNQTNYGIVRVKRFQDKADLNQILLISSDPKYFRYRGFKALITMADHHDLTIPDGLGTMIEGTAQGLVNAIGKNGFVFGQRYSMEAAVNEVKEIIELYTLKNELSF